MFVELTRVERYRDKEHQEGAIIEVGAALGERLILNDHKPSSRKEFEKQHHGVNPLSAQEIEQLDYKRAQEIVKLLDLEVASKSHEAYKDALSAYFLT